MIGQIKYITAGFLRKKQTAEINKGRNRNTLSHTIDTCAPGAMRIKEETDGSPEQNQKPAIRLSIHANARNHTRKLRLPENEINERLTKKRMPSFLLLQNNGTELKARYIICKLVNMHCFNTIHQKWPKCKQFWPYKPLFVNYADFYVNIIMSTIATNLINECTLCHERQDVAKARCTTAQDVGLQENLQKFARG